MVCAKNDPIFHFQLRHQHFPKNASDRKIIIFPVSVADVDDIDENSKYCVVLLFIILSFL